MSMSNEKMEQPTTIAGTDALQVPTSSTHARNTSHPPPDVPDGGSWGKVKYQGDKSCLFGVIFCLFTCCPIWVCLKIDNKDAYSVEGKVRAVIHFCCTLIQQMNRSGLIFTQPFYRCMMLLGLT